MSDLNLNIGARPNTPPVHYAGAPAPKLTPEQLGSLSLQELSSLASKGHVDLDALPPAVETHFSQRLSSLMEGELEKNYTADARALSTAIARSMLKIEEVSGTTERHLFNASVAQQEKSLKEKSDAINQHAQGRRKSIIADGVNGGVDVVGGAAAGRAGLKSAKAATQQQMELSKARHNDAIARPHEMGKADMADVKRLQGDINKLQAEGQEVDGLRVRGEGVTHSPMNEAAINARLDRIQTKIASKQDDLRKVQERPAQRAEESATAHDKAGEFDRASVEQRTRETAMTTWTRAADSFVQTAGKTEELKDTSEADLLEKQADVTKLEADVAQNYSRGAGESRAKARSAFDDMRQLSQTLANGTGTEPLIRNMG